MLNEATTKPGVPDNIYVGTSGYSYRDWVGPFYPKGTKSGNMLDYYSRFFRTVELNFPYYRMPNAKMMAAIAAKAAGRVQFTIKLIKELTHEGSRDTGIIRQYLDGIAPLLDDGVAECLLAQFPWKMKYNPAAIDHLKWLREKFEGIDIAVEFRNDSWACNEVYDQLRELNLTFVNVDEPDLKGLMPRTDIVTSGTAYFRFHGRNKEKWWKPQRAEERYDYLYSKDQLSDWAPKIKYAAQQTNKTYVFMNNHPLGQAVTNAAQIMEMLGQEFLDLDVDTDNRLF